MSGQWYFARNGQKIGPFGFEQLRQMTTSGVLSPGDMVLAEGTPQWTSAGTVSGLFAELPPPPPPEPSPPAEPSPQRGVPGMTARRPPDEPTVAATADLDADRHRAWQRLYRTAQRQRLLNLTVAAVIVLDVAGAFLLPARVYPLVRFALAVAALGIVGLSMALCRAAGLNVWVRGGLLAVLFALSLAPGSPGIGPVEFHVASLLLVLEVSGRATQLLRAEGIRVGFLGAGLPEQPPDWFRRTRGAPSSPQGRLRRASYWVAKTFQFSLLVALLLFIAYFSAEKYLAENALGDLVGRLLFLAFALAGLSAGVYGLLAVARSLIWAGAMIGVSPPADVPPAPLMAKENR